MMARFMNKRHGVTLIEVLFAIGIVVAGLLGIAALIPVAGAKARNGIETDRMALIGQGAVRAIETYGMNNVDNLRYFNITNQQFQAYNPSNNDYIFSPNIANERIGNLAIIRTSEVYVPALQRFVNQFPNRRESFCIDPLFFAYHAEAGNLSNVNIARQAVVFPYEHTDNPVSSPNPSNPTSNDVPFTHVPRMRRITLQPVPFDHNNYDSRRLSGDPLPNNPYMVRQYMSAYQAKHWFVPRDELSYDLPDDDTLDPIPNMGTSRVTGDHQRRQFEGTLSWFATMTPVMQSWDMGDSLRFRPLGGPIRGNFEERSDRYLLSVVIMARRDPFFELNSTNERVVTVQNFWSGGFGGGDVELFSTTEEALKVKEDQWILLAANSSVGEVFRWYQIISADVKPRPQANPGGFVIDVTLKGPDWDRPEWHPYDPNNPRMGPGAGSNHQKYVTRAVIMDGVIGVFEKTIHLELVSDWKL